MVMDDVSLSKLFASLINIMRRSLNSRIMFRHPRPVSLMIFSMCFDDNNFMTLASLDGEHTNFIWPCFLKISCKSGNRFYRVWKKGLQVQFSNEMSTTYLIGHFGDVFFSISRTFNSSFHFTGTYGTEAKPVQFIWPSRWEMCNKNKILYAGTDEFIK